MRITGRRRMDARPLDSQYMDAIRILDSALGVRSCGIVVSGRGTPRFSCEESPFQLTMRSLVAPVMSILGYGDPRYNPNLSESPDGTAMAMVPMNRPLDDAIRQTMTVMRSNGIPRGISTDGFVWVSSGVGPYGPKVMQVFDLRPYYIEALDRSRFRAAVPVGRGIAEDFLTVLGRNGASREGR